MDDNGGGSAQNGGGKPADDGRRLATVVTYLEMRGPSHAFVPPPANLRMTLMKAEKPTVHYYRYLYGAVGDRYHWVDRKRLSDEELAAIIGADTVALFVAYAHGVPAGFFELDERAPGELWLAYFGVIPDFHGRGIGKWLLAEAIDEAFSRDIDVFRVETCTLDHPGALPLYQKMGFVPYERRDKVVVID